MALHCPSVKTETPSCDKTSPNLTPLPAPPSCPPLASSPSCTLSQPHQRGWALPRKGFHDHAPWRDLFPLPSAWQALLHSPNLRSNPNPSVKPPLIPSVRLWPSSSMKPLPCIYIFILSRPSRTITQVCLPFWFPLLGCELQMVESYCYLFCDSTLRIESRRRYPLTLQRWEEERKDFLV